MSSPDSYDNEFSKPHQMVGSSGAPPFATPKPRATNLAPPLDAVEAALVPEHLRAVLSGQQPVNAPVCALMLCRFVLLFGRCTDCGGDVS